MERSSPDYFTPKYSGRRQSCSVIYKLSDGFDFFFSYFCNISRILMKVKQTFYISQKNWYMSRNTHTHTHTQINKYKYIHTLFKPFVPCNPFNIWNKNQMMSLFQFYLYIAGSLHVSGPQAHPQGSSHSCSHNHWFSVCTALAVCSVTGHTARAVQTLKQWLCEQLCELS